MGQSANWTAWGRREHELANLRKEGRSGFSRRWSKRKKRYTERTVEQETDRSFRAFRSLTRHDSFGCTVNRVV